MVARLTGLTVHNIRAWEKRYAVVEPTRTDTQRRLYTREDIRRLTLLKSLVDSGQPIGTIAKLSIEQLEERIRESGLNNERIAAVQLPEIPQGSSQKVRVALVGGQIQTLFASGTDHSDQDFEIVGKFETLADLANQRPVTDLLMVDCPALFDDIIDQVSAQAARIGARRSLLIYGFAHKDALQSLGTKTRITAIPGPTNLEELRLACLADIEIARGPGDSEPSGPKRDLESENPQEIPPVRFSTSQLAKLAKISSALDCECPQHLANLLFSLTAFEAYSAQCESRDEKDAKLHQFLRVETAQARSTIENALARLLKEEGIKI